MIKIFFENRVPNFGDMLNPYLIEMLSGQKVEALPVNRMMEAQIICCGSILDAVPDDYRGYIWGTGFMWAHTQKEFPYAKLLAVRGAETAERILRSFDDVALGDPGIIISLMDKFKGIEKKYEIGIVPHYVDRANEDVRWVIDHGAKYISVFDNVEKVICRIAQCEKITSSSLHGLVIADALGVRNTYVKYSDKVAGKGFKFDDYKTTSIDTLKDRARKLVELFPFKGGSEWQHLL